MIKRKFEWGRSGKIERFEDVESGQLYRRICCGFAWPFSAMAGFICVLAEDLKPDHSLPHSPRHLRILHEFESSNLESLLRRCWRIKEEFDLKRILGNGDSPLVGVWNQSPRQGQKIHFSRPYDFERLTLNLVSQLVRRLTERGYKALHFGDQSRFPSYLSTLTAEDIEHDKDIQAYPAIAALGYCLCEMAQIPPKRAAHRWKTGNRGAMAV